MTLPLPITLAPQLATDLGAESYVIYPFFAYGVCYWKAYRHITGEGGFSAGGIPYRDNFSQGGKFPGVSFPGEILHWETSSGLPHENLFIYLTCLTLPTKFNTSRCSRGNFQRGWDYLENCFLGRGLSLEEILHGEIFGGELSTGDGGFRGKFQLRVDFWHDLKIGQKTNCLSNEGIPRKIFADEIVHHSFPRGFSARMNLSRILRESNFILRNFL